MARPPTRDRAPTIHPRLWRRWRPALPGALRHAPPADQRGFVILLWTISFLGILAFLVVVADAGLTFMERRSMQNVADGAALAGARALLLDGETAAQADTTAFAATADGDLAENTAIASATTMEVTSRVADNAQSLFPGSPISFNEPLVAASATARVGTYVLPGPGVFCIGSFAGDVDAAHADQLLQLPNYGATVIWQLSYAQLLAGDFYDVLRFGAGEGSNPGYLDIGNQGGASQAVRECFANGSVTGLQPSEPTETGIATGPASQGLRTRLLAAQANGCYSWDEISADLQQADPDNDGLLENSFRCSPYRTQDSSVVLLPVIEGDFTSNQGAQIVDVDFVPAAGQYRLAYFWLDAEETFVNTSAGNWQFQSDTGQGQAEITGVFLGPVLTELNDVPQGSGGTVACVVGVSTGCFLQLID